MTSLSPVVWKEGMHLAQHHFQAQSGYLENVITFAIENLFFRAYGLVGIELDAEALLNGTASLRHARGVMPDGLAFHFPHDPPPAAIEIGEVFSPTQDSHLLLLALPRYRPGQANCAIGQGGNHQRARFAAATVQIPDEVTGEDEKTVSVATKNFRLALDHQLNEGEVSMPLARVRRDGSGNFIYDPAYIPPALQIGASERLLQLLGRLLDILEAKAAALQAERQSDQPGHGEYASRELVSFWLSHAVHASLPPLRHHLRTRSPHPEQLYVELSRLAGALCTFSIRSDPQSLPLYDHDQLGDCFDALDRHIRDHLEIVLPTNAVSVALGRVTAEELAVHLPVGETIPPALSGPYFHKGAVTDRRCFGRAHWFLGVRAEGSEANLISEVQKKVKICSAKYIVRLVMEGLPGLPIEHVPSPPAELSPRLATRYFRIRAEGPCWQSIVEMNEIGIYIPAALRDVELDVRVLLES